MEAWHEQVSLAQNGDVAAYGAVVGRFRDMACGYAYALLRDRHLAEDAAQEAFLQAFRELRTLSSPLAFPGWLKRIVFKHCDRISRRKRVPLLPIPEHAEDAAGPQPVREACRQEMAQRVLAALASLPAGLRTVAQLHYMDGQSRRSIAERLDVPITTVHNRLHAARKRLRASMAGLVDEEIARRVREKMDAGEDSGEGNR